MHRHHLTPALCLALALASLTAQAARVEFDPAEREAQVGATFSVSLVARDFAANLDGGGVSLAFDPAVLTFLGADFDPAWDFFTDAGVLDAAAGILLDLQFNQFGSPRIGDFAIVTLTFQALAPGVSTLTLTPGANPFASGGEVVAVSLGSGQVAVVPLPASLTLLPLGLMMLGLRRRTAPLVASRSSSSSRPRSR